MTCAGQDRSTRGLLDPHVAEGLPRLVRQAAVHSELVVTRHPRELLSSRSLSGAAARRASPDQRDRPSPASCRAWVMRTARTSPAADEPHVCSARGRRRSPARCADHPTERTSAGRFPDGLEHLRRNEGADRHGASGRGDAGAQPPVPAAPRPRRRGGRADLRGRVLVPRPHRRTGRLAVHRAARTVRPRPRSGVVAAPAPRCGRPAGRAPDPVRPGRWRRVTARRLPPRRRGARPPAAPRHRGGRASSAWASAPSSVRRHR